MKPQFQPWHLLLLILAGWINRRQQDVIEYLLTENRVLRQKLGRKRILLNDDQRRLLFAKIPAALNLLTFRVSRFDTSRP